MNAASKRGKFRWSVAQPVGAGSSASEPASIMPFIANKITLRVDGAKGHAALFGHVLHFGHGPTRPTRPPSAGFIQCRRSGAVSSRPSPQRQGHVSLDSPDLDIDRTLKAASSPVSHSGTRRRISRPLPFTLRSSHVQLWGPNAPFPEAKPGHGSDHDCPFFRCRVHCPLAAPNAIGPCKEQDSCLDSPLVRQEVNHSLKNYSKIVLTRVNLTVMATAVSGSQLCPRCDCIL